ncbi:MAG: fructose-6-phosphate aldolase, partial [Lachnospiraceae bacterium]|nr:fructose-6-phosphate aldolase [Lachnospiraceae bacterium]
MKLLIDDAHIDIIKKLYEFYPIDGVTTNPSILAKSGRPPYEVLKEIRAFIGKDADLHVQALAMDAEGMVRDAHRIVKELGEATLVKIPCIPEGFKAMK